ncbi:xanthine dehydrogenase family protein subunit M [bacterium]|nr:xanthine dehydrogenase family protein subunit M [bacterium]
MEIRDFQLHRPRSLAEACALGARLGEAARYCAGGTELIVDFRARRDGADHLISLREVPGLATIAVQDDDLRIGAMVSIAEIAESPLVAARFPALGLAARLMAGAQIRAQATIGGNFCRAVSCADTPPTCIAGEARLAMASAEGERQLAAEDFFTGPRQTVLRPGEIVTAILLPAQPVGSGADYQRFTLRAGQALAVAAVAARLVLVRGVITEARLCLGAVAPTPLLVPAAAAILERKRPSEALFAEAAAAAAAAARPICDLRGSDEYRRDLVRVLARRALAMAAARAQEAGR